MTRRRPPSTPRRGEDGFTLVELITAMVLMGVVAFPLIDSFVEAVKTTGATSNSLGSSHDAQLVDYYLQRDAAGATPSTSPAAWACAAAAGVTVGSAGASGVVQFVWFQAAVATGSTLASGYPAFANGASYESDYVYQAGDLTRYYCTVSGGVGTTRQTNKVASSLSLTTPPTVTSLNSSCTSSGQGTCTTVAWTDSTGKTYSTVLYDRSFGS